MTRIGLHMIVKNEAHVIERALRSAIPHIDYWVICDTGSTDGTQEIIQNIMDEAGISGKLVEVPWVDFGTNRQQSLELLRDFYEDSEEDYALWIDADDEFTGTLNKDLLTQAGYMFNVEQASVSYPRIHLFRLHEDFQWKGVLHEAIYVGSGLTTHHLPGFTVRAYHEGARSKDPDTYKKDSTILKAYLDENPGDARTQFYLAQSYRDAGMLQESYDMYILRSQNPSGWDKEQAYACHQAAGLAEQLYPENKSLVGDLLVTAWELNPARNEPLIGLVWLEFSRNRRHTALMWAQTAVMIEKPTHDLFLDPESYTWKHWNALSVACLLTGNKKMGTKAAQKVLKFLPNNPQVMENLHLLRKME